jgi:hypothetical protein
MVFRSIAGLGFAVVVGVTGMSGVGVHAVRAYLDDGKVPVKCESGELALRYVGWSNRCVWVATHRSSVDRKADISRRTAELFVHADGTAHLSVSENYRNGTSIGSTGRSYGEARAGAFTDTPKMTSIKLVRFVDGRGQELDLVRVGVRVDDEKPVRQAKK